MKKYILTIKELTAHMPIYVLASESMRESKKTLEMIINLNSNKIHFCVRHNYDDAILFDELQNAIDKYNEF